MTLITVTLNPAIDETVTLTNFQLGAVNRALAAQHHAGGKGINVAACLADWGAPVTATGILGAGNTKPFESLFAAKSITSAFLTIPGETRANIKLSHDGETTDINFPGLTLEPPQIKTFVTHLNALAAPGDIILLAGSLPPGAPPTLYAELLASLTATGARIILDTSGPPLAAALTTSARPYAIKPNRAELEEFFGHPLPTTQDILAAARTLIERGITLAVISLGAKGALFTTSTAALLARTAPIPTPSTVGAGDAMVAGLIAALAEDAPLARLARLATAFAAAKLSRAGPSLPPRAEVEAIAAAVELKELFP